MDKTKIIWLYQTVRITSLTIFSELFDLIEALWVYYDFISQDIKAENYSLQYQDGSQSNEEKKKILGVDNISEFLKRGSNLKRAIFTVTPASKKYLIFRKH